MEFRTFSLSRWKMRVERERERDEATESRVGWDREKDKMMERRKMEQQEMEKERRKTRKRVEALLPTHFLFLFVPLQVHLSWQRMGKQEGRRHQPKSHPHLDQQQR